MCCKKFYKWASKKIRKLKVYHISLIKISVFGFAWFIAAWFVRQPEWFHNLWWVWLLVGVIAAIIPGVNVFKK